MTTDFLKIIDNSQSTLDEIKDDYIKLADNLHVDISTHYSPEIIHNKIIDLIRSDLFESDLSKSQPVDNLDKLAEYLVYINILLNKPILDYLNILRVIRLVVTTEIKTIPVFENNIKWQHILINARNYKLLTNNSDDITKETIRENYPQVYDRAIQLKRLKEMGCEISFINNIVEIKGIEKPINHLNSLIKKIGGLTLAKSIFTFLSQPFIYSTQFERYHLTRNGNSLNFIKQTQIPFGYLLNLSMKYPYEYAYNNINNNLIEIKELSVAIVTGYYNVQHYNQWINFFQTGETIIHYCTEMALWDSIYSIVQIRPSLAYLITQDLLENVDNASFEKALKFNKSDFYFVVKEIIDKANNRNGPVTIYFSFLRRSLKNIDKRTIMSILDLLSHDSTPNKDYLFPSDITKVDFNFKPLIKLSKTKFLMMDKSWCSPSIYESVASKLRNSITGFESSIGYSIEKLIYKWLKSKDILFSHGEFKGDLNDGECDLLIESESSIIIIELKKKVLTRRAKSGTDIDLLIDLSDSILSSQIQAGKVEIILREKGEICLKDKNGQISNVQLNDRCVERISLTHLDFGGFHDRTLIDQFFSALLTHKYRTYSEDTRIIEKFEQLNKKQDEWINQYKKLDELDINFRENPFFNCWFLNLGHLLEIINISNDNESFYEKINQMKHVTFGTMDFYKEFELINNRSK